LRDAIHRGNCTGIFWSTLNFIDTADVYMASLADGCRGRGAYNLVLRSGSAGAADAADDFAGFD
jgi:hypothetical protein